MSKYPSQYHKLPKKQQERYFPNEHGNGKGSHERKNTEEGRKRYRDNYDRIEWNISNG